MNRDCLFCKIADKKIPAEVVYEDGRTVAFLDINPRAPAHTVVIPKYHSETIADLPDAEVCPLFLAIKKVADLLVKSLKAEGLTIGINQGRASGQVVDHLHVHLLPRFKSDGGSSVHGVVHNPPEESLQEVARKLREYKDKK